MLVKWCTLCIGDCNQKGVWIIDEFSSLLLVGKTGPTQRFRLTARLALSAATFQACEFTQPAPSARKLPLTPSALNKCPFPREPYLGKSPDSPRELCCLPVSSLAPCTFPSPFVWYSNELVPNLLPFTTEGLPQGLGGMGSVTQWLKPSLHSYTVRVQNPILPLTICVIWVELFNSSSPLFISNTGMATILTY